MPKSSNAYTTAYQLGKNYINTMKNNNFSNLKYPAVMFDIDDTLIDYNGKPIKPIIKLLNTCIKAGLIVVIITARDYKYYDITIDQLLKWNIDYEFLFLRNPGDDIKKFKSNIKQKLAEENDIVTIMSVGDNVIDVDGPYSGYFIKLPNKYSPDLFHLSNSRQIQKVQY